MSKSETHGALVKQYLQLKKRISKTNKTLEDLRSQAYEIEKQLIPMLEEAKLERVDIVLGSVKLKSEPVYSVEGKNWKKFYKWVFANKNENVLQHRLSQAAVRELVEDGVKLPGVTRMIKKSLSHGFKRGGK